MDQLEKASLPRAGSPFRGSFARALLGAAVGTLIVATIAFGAGVRPSFSTTAAAADAEEPTPTDVVSTAVPIDLALHLEDGFVRIDWSVCDTNGFRFYALVRSTDEEPTWPVGDGDTLVAVVEDIDETAFHDPDLPPGTVLFYRVFALADPIAEIEVICESAVRSVAIPGTPPTPTPTPTPEPTPTPTPEPTPTPTPEPTPTPTPTPKPDPTPTPKPDPSMTLVVSIKDGKPYVDWSRCSGRFDWYKVVRSTDATVSWPMGEGDSLAAYIGRDGKTAFWDRNAPAGTTVWYRVFCVRASHGGYKVVDSSPTKSIEVPAKKADPVPDPVALGFEVNLTDNGVKLHWEATANKWFVAYKVVRSAGPNPSYLPGTEGTQLIAVVSNPRTRWFTDTHLEAGQTWYYRVQAIGSKNGHKFLIGQTAAIAITFE